MTMIGCYANKVLVGEDNIDELREHITYSDQADEITIGMVISHYAFTYDGGNRGDTTVYHNEGRAAVGLGGDSLWGDWNDEEREIVMDDGTRYDVEGEIIEEDETEA